ncbi:hypothetical protein QJ857_gp0243 [Tupanvirus soda lake]|uniref:DUF378 domain-containing protein n=2 Tax=Tupanvirus TaxID=2094720 RepID=A0A6N1P1T8_9VIRU|nr:hypothetical protein QJ857_gp0243 [Tupanvirus soda lake]QKU35782.1 hypothetical protein [Tupanvirus soda lake]
MALSAVWVNRLIIISLVLVIIGALNWGWIGLTSNNLVASINNATFRNEWFERLIYILVGLAGIYLLINWGLFYKADHF